MTDKEIIKALECHTSQECVDCPYDKGLLEPCIRQVMKDALDLINQQRAEIERLTDRNKRLGEGVGWLLNNENGIELIRAEAIKEFAKKLKIEIDMISYETGDEYEKTIDTIDDLVKEMVADNG